MAKIDNILVQSEKGERGGGEYSEFEGFSKISRVEASNYFKFFIIRETVHVLIRNFLCFISFLNF